MTTPLTIARPSLGLRAGEWVEVRSREAILRTLDDEGRLDGLPFMPEMLQFCGKRFRVFKSAHKTCDTIKTYGALCMPDAVHLEGLRCDGAAHGNCQARCLLFWKEAWLQRVDAADPEQRPQRDQPDACVADVSTLALHTRRPPGAGEADGEYFSCQATRLLDATRPLHWYDPRHYLKDLLSKNVRLSTFARFTGYAAVRAVMRRFGRDPAQRPGKRASGAAPPEALNLQPGEIVRVRRRDEIYATLNSSRKMQGLWYDIEMEPMSGREFRVLARVDRLIDERTGKMLALSRDCVILDGAVCSGCRSMNRLFCPRSLYPFWREAWLERASRSSDGPPETRPKT